MNTSKKFAIGAVIAISATVAYHKATQKVTIDRFPELDRKILKKAYNLVLIDALTGQLDGEMEDDALDAKLLETYNTLIRIKK